MTAAKLKPWEMPGWPLWMDARMASAYVGLGVEKFREEVQLGLWPAPKRPCLWYRPDIDAESEAKAGRPGVNRSAGSTSGSADVEDLDAIRAQMKARTKVAKGSGSEVKENDRG